MFTAASAAPRVVVAEALSQPATGVVGTSHRRSGHWFVSNDDQLITGVVEAIGLPLAVLVMGRQAASPGKVPWRVATGSASGQRWAGWEASSVMMLGCAGVSGRRAGCAGGSEGGSPCSWIDHGRFGDNAWSGSAARSTKGAGSSNAA